MSAVLIIDDSITIRQGIKLALKKASVFDDYLEARNGSEGIEKLDANSVDLVLCDVVMPEKDGFEFLEEMKRQEKYADIPVIMLTGQESVDKKILGLNLGASDYLTKPFDPGELIARVKVQLKIKSLQDELKAANERYRELSITDYLTKLYNRRHFMELSLREFERCKRYNHDLSLVMCDLDHFKSINDTLGHQVGDAVLADLGQILMGNLRGHDVVARYGGEEFIILLPMAGNGEVVSVAEKLRHRVEKHQFPGVDDRNVTISLGISCFPYDNPQSIDELITLADKALYHAKRTGRNKVVRVSDLNQDDLSED